MRMGIGLGVGINRSNYAQGIFNAYALRVTADGGITEAGQCVDAVSGLLLNASLLLIPSGFKGGRLYSQIPTNGNGDLTWSRASDAFRTNASGLIQRVPWNLLSWSEDFSNASWTKTNVTVSANSTTAPNGTLTADTMTPDATNTTHRVSFLGSAGTAAYTLSVFAKSNGYNFLQIAGATSIDHYANFNLSTGVVTQTGLGTTTSVTNFGNGWYRCSITIPAISSSNILINVVNSGTSSWQEAFTANGTSGIFIWGAQLVEGTTAQTYLPTTDRLNFPRLDYTYGSCPAVLLEPQRTNLALQSETFDNASWIKQNASITANTTTSPDGSTNADSFIENTGLGQHFTYQQLTKAASSITYSFSVYYKNAIGTRNFALGITNGTTSGKGAIFTTSGTITATNATIGSGVGFTFVSADVQSVGNGFYRASIVVTTDTATRVDAVAYLSDSTTSISNYTGNGTSAIFIYGAQLEVGAYPTTYIPTTSATATRVADSFSRNNIFTNGLITSSGGTWFVELKGNETRTPTTEVVSAGLELGNSAGNATEAFKFRRGGGASRVNIWKTVGGTQSQIYELITATAKIAIKWNGTSADVFVNGTKVVSATSFTATTSLEFVRYIADQVPTFIQQMALFPTPLSDTDCTTLTTL